jgi:hypothetical protein
MTSSFTTEFGMATTHLVPLHNLYADLLAKYDEDLKAVKENKFFLVEFPEYKAQYWTNFESAVLHKCQNDIPPDKHKKLADDYIFLVSMANYPSEDNVADPAPSED